MPCIGQPTIQLGGLAGGPPRTLHVRAGPVLPYVPRAVFHTPEPPREGEEQAEWRGGGEKQQHEDQNGTENGSRGPIQPGPPSSAAQLSRQYADSIRRPRSRRRPPHPRRLPVRPVETSRRRRARRPLAVTLLEAPLVTVLQAPRPPQVTRRRPLQRPPLARPLQRPPLVRPLL